MVKIADSQVCVSLTMGELAFLASAAGVRELSITDQTHTSLTAKEISDAIVEGRKSLELRHLFMRMDGGEGLIDQSLYLLIRPALFPEWVIRAETHRIDRAEFWFVCYRQHHLLVEYNLGEYYFTVCREPTLRKQWFMEKAGISATTRLTAQVPEKENPQFISRFLFTQFNAGIPYTTRSLTMFVKNDVVWLSSPGKSDVKKSRQEIYEMEWIETNPLSSLRK